MMLFSLFLWSASIFVSVTTSEQSWKFNRCPNKCVCSLRFDTLVESHLRTVNCTSKRLTQFPKTTLIPADAQVLLLQDNLLRRIPSNLRLHLPDLISLNLSHNNLVGALSHQIGIFEGVFNLRYLDLSHNKLTILPEDVFQGLISLRTLDLSHNRLGGIMEDAFEGLDYLETLNLAHNKIGYVHESWWRPLHMLNSLNLRHNYLNVIQDDSFSTLHRLRHLYLDNNRIFKIGDYGLHGLSELATLSLNNNHFEHVPASGLTRVRDTVKHIYLDSNPIFKVHMDDFANMNKLVDVGLNSMQRLRIVDRGAFKNLNSFALLEMHDNPYLSYIDSLAFINCGAVTHLLVHNNNLTILEEDMVDSLSSLATISFYGNSLACDCNAKWMRKSLRHGLELQEFERIVCASPQQHKFKLFHKLDIEQLPDKCAPTILHMFEHENYRKVGSSISYNCRAVGVPRPKLIWVTPEGHLITPSQFHPRRTLKNGDTLEIDDIRVEDMGIYTCIAESESGSSAVQTYLNVTKLEVELEVAQTTENSATVYWKGSDRRDRAFQLLYRELSDDSENDVSVHMQTVTPIMKTFTFHNLKPNTIYEACLGLQDSMKNLAQISCVHLQTDISERAAYVSERTGNAFIGAGLGLLVGALIILCLALFGLRKARPCHSKFDYDNLESAIVSHSKTCLISNNVTIPNDYISCESNSSNEKVRTGYLQPMHQNYYAVCGNSNGSFVHSPKL